MADKQKKIWVRSAKVKQGELQPIHLVETTTIVDNDVLRVSIDKRMAKEKIPVEVLDCPFVRHFIKSDILEIVPSNKAKEQARIFWKNVKEKQAPLLKSLAYETDKERKAVDAAKEAYAEIKREKNVL